MTIEQKALELVNAVMRERGYDHVANTISRKDCFASDEALCRALEAHEADKARHAAELREQAERFSEAAAKAKELIETWVGNSDESGAKAAAFLSPFILAPVDPLVEVMSEVDHANDAKAADQLRAALEARGLAIVKKEAVNG